MDGLGVSTGIATASSSGPGGRLTAFRKQLIDIHIWLREELARLCAEVDSHLAGRGGGPAPRPGGLPAHCLAFCSALGQHHAGEDAVAFPLLAEQFLELRPVLDTLFAAPLDDQPRGADPVRSALVAARQGPHRQAMTIAAAAPTCAAAG